MYVCLLYRYTNWDLPAQEGRHVKSSILYIKKPSYTTLTFVCEICGILPRWESLLRRIAECEICVQDSDSAGVHCKYVNVHQTELYKLHGKVTLCNEKEKN